MKAPPMKPESKHQTCYQAAKVSGLVTTQLSTKNKGNDSKADLKIIEIVETT